MVSDVLFEAMTAIEECLTPPSAYEGKERDMITALYDHMDKVRAYLDTPPGTEREKTLENETRK